MRVIEKRWTGGALDVCPFCVLFLFLLDHLQCVLPRILPFYWVLDMQCKFTVSEKYIFVCSIAPV